MPKNIRLILAGHHFARDEIRSLYDILDSFTDSDNVLVMPSLDATNILFNVLKVEADKGVTVSLILLGTARPVHVLSLSGHYAPHLQYGRSPRRERSSPCRNAGRTVSSCRLPEGHLPAVRE